jgi:hypothetical protein
MKWTGNVARTGSLGKACKIFAVKLNWKRLLGNKGIHLTCDDGNFIGVSYARVLYDVQRNNVKK